MEIYYKELELESGFELAKLPKHSRILGGRELSLCSGMLLFEAMRGQPIVCWHCKCQADRWISTKGKNDHRSNPVLNLYAVKKNGAVVLMTRDHIIPKSLGGVDAVQNLRPGCADCNSKRGATLNKRDKTFMLKHPELIDAVRLLKGRLAAERKAAEDAAYRLSRHAEAAGIT
jgi:hypothetical protein